MSRTLAPGSVPTPGAFFPFCYTAVYQPLPHPASLDGVDPDLITEKTDYGVTCLPLYNLLSYHS